ncbi:AAA family ATPase [Vibrio metschnikovii]|uniref:AAA family ATPase n=1 Tax=Vibrio metschnikovii TaxID=28172 RepID=UPI001C2F7749|nr:AAA family ATPase [Vibrio metschnikovii]
MSFKQTADPLKHPDMAQALSIIRKVVFQRSPRAKQVLTRDLKEAMKYLDIQHGARRYFARKLGKLPKAAHKVEWGTLDSIDVPGHPLELETEVCDILRESWQIYGCCVLSCGRPAVEGLQFKAMYQLLDQAAANIPGQRMAAKLAAQKLASQLCNTAKKRTPSLFLHGPDGAGAIEMAHAFAKTLAKEEGFNTLEINLANLRSDGEVSSLDGSKSYWGGSKPGRLTSALYHNPRTVVILRGADRTLPRVQEPLVTALNDGFMIDNYGLEKGPGMGHPDKEDTRPETHVDTSQAIFIFIASEGSNWYDNAELRSLLAEEQDRYAAIRDVLRYSTRRHPMNGHETLIFNCELLAAIEPNLVLLQPLDWATQLATVINNLPLALQVIAKQVGCKITIPPALIRQLAQIHLLSCQDAGLRAASAESIATNLFSDLALNVLEQPRAVSEIRVSLDDQLSQTVNQLLKDLGPEPLSTLRKQKRLLKLYPTITFSGRLPTLRFAKAKLARIFVMNDFTGKIKLIAKVPEKTLAQVHGHKAAKDFLREMIGYLRQAEHSQSLGVELPRGVLLYGEPGTGKTALAKGFSGEAGLPFLAVDSTDLLQPENLNQLYRIARDVAPCVIFIDEADALGSRGCQSARHDLAITKLLTEIQGFSSKAPIFHILATNKPDKLDPALVRSGRIDRRFHIGSLETEARRAFVSELKKLVPLSIVEQEKLVKASHGLTGAQLTMLKRETGLRLLREGKLNADAVFEELDNLRYGERLAEDREQDLIEQVATHECGHALVHYLLFPAQPITMLSIVSRNSDHEGFLAVQKKRTTSDAGTIRDQLVVLLAGRMAEIKAFGHGKLSTGAISDLAQATTLANSAIALGGMDEVVGPVSIAGLDHIPDSLAEQILARVRVWLMDAEERAKALLNSHQHLLAKLTHALINRESLDTDELKSLLEPHNQGELK